jgi:hypothetical protein
LHNLEVTGAFGFELVEAIILGDGHRKSFDTAVRFEAVVLVPQFYQHFLGGILGFLSTHEQTLGQPKDLVLKRATSVTNCVDPSFL